MLSLCAGLKFEGQVHKLGFSYLDFGWLSAGRLSGSSNRHQGVIRGAKQIIALLHNLSILPMVEPKLFPPIHGVWGNKSGKVETAVSPDGTVMSKGEQPSFLRQLGIA